MEPLAEVSLEDVRTAARRIGGSVIRTPLLRLEQDGGPEIYLKLENLQPIGSFKLRGATNSVAAIDPARLGEGLSTASAGNMGRAVAWLAQQHGVPCTVIVPDTAPAAKLDPLRALGARIVAEPFERWWQALEEGGHPALTGTFLHPVASSPMIAGNGTIGLELIEDLPGVEAVVVPFGGGGLSAASPARSRPFGRESASTPRRWRARRRSLPRWRPAIRCRSSIGTASWTASAQAACWPRCGR